MKKLIVLFIVMCSFIPLSWAMDGCNQHLSPDEFRAKQKAYITEKAGLTKEEAATQIRPDYSIAPTASDGAVDKSFFRMFFYMVPFIGL